MPVMIFLVPSLPIHTTRAIFPQGKYRRSLSSRERALTVASWHPNRDGEASEHRPVVVLVGRTKGRVFHGLRGGNERKDERLGCLFRACVDVWVCGLRTIGRPYVRTLLEGHKARVISFLPRFLP